MEAERRVAETKRLERLNKIQEEDDDNLSIDIPDGEKSFLDQINKIIDNESEIHSQISGQTDAKLLK